MFREYGLLKITANRVYWTVVGQKEWNFEMILYAERLAVHISKLSTKAFIVKQGGELAMY